MKKLLIIFTLVAALLLSAATALAATPSLVDKAHLLTASERAQVQAQLQAVEQKYGIRCAVVTMGSIGNTKPGIYANQLIDKVFNDGPNGNIVFLQVTDQRQWYISTDKKLKEVVVGIPGTEYISKAAVPYLKKGDEAGAYKTYAKRVDDLMAYYNKHGKGWQPENDCAIVKGDSSVHDAMVPVWISTNRYKDEPYTFRTNGQTGEVVGSLPIDEGKLRKRLLIAFAITVVIALAVLYAIL